MSRIAMRLLVKAAMWLASHPDEVIAAVHEIKTAAAASK